jgi:LPXTG-site transpeptidase (sortase) family protein
VNRHSPVVLAAALLSLLVLPACSPQAGPAPEVAPLPSVSTSPLPTPRPAAAADATPAPAAPPVPTTGTDPARTLPSRATEPVRLEVDDVEIAMPVIPVGVDAGTMALPESVADVGWYEFGSRPGDRAGTTVLAAHVDSTKEGLGPFARLRAIRTGADVTLTTRDGTVHRYEISSVRKIPKREVPLSEVFDRGGSPRLTLITCGGAYDRETGYTDNVVVTARPEPAVS